MSEEKVASTSPAVRPPGGATALPERGMEPLLLLLALIALACVLTWTLPAGRYERHRDEATNRTLVVPGSYASVSRTPVGPWRGLGAVSRGLVDAAPVIFYVLLSGAALTVVERTGALGRVIDHLSLALADHPVVIVPLISTLFAIGGATYGMYEEIIAFLPVLCALAFRMRFDALTAVAMSVGTASVASSFSPVETFKLSIAQPLAEVPMFSGFAFRTIVFVPVMLFWVGFVAWHASRIRRAALAADVTGPSWTPLSSRPPFGRATSPSWPS